MGNEDVAEEKAGEGGLLQRLLQQPALNGEITVHPEASMGLAVHDQHLPPSVPRRSTA